MDPQKAWRFELIIGVIAAIPLLLYIFQKFTGQPTVDRIWMLVSAVVITLLVIANLTR